MEVFLSKQCESLTGSFGRGFGYYIRSTKKKRFFSQRSRHSVPPDGHWRFIIACARLAEFKLHISDVQVSADELREALEEAHHFVAAQMVHDIYYGKNKTTYHANDILNLKTTFGL